MQTASDVTGNDRLPDGKAARKLSRGSWPLFPLILSLGVVAPLLLSTWYTVRVQEAALQAGFDYEFDRLADVLAHGMSDPVWNLIPNSGEPLVESMMKDERILMIDVASLAQGSFLRRDASERAGPDSKPVRLSRPVIRDGVRIGAVSVTVDASAMHAALAAQQRRIVAAGAIATLFSLALVLVAFQAWRRLARERELTDLNRQLQEEVAERRQAEAALRESEGLIGSVLQNSPSAIFLKDVEGRYLVANPRFVEWFGLSAEAVLGRTAEELYPEEQAQIFASQDRDVLEGGARIEREILVPFADGNLHAVMVSKFPVYDATGKVTGIGALVNDVTEFRNAEEQLRQAQKLRALGQLTGGVAHDFNNLLAVIVGNAEILEEDLGRNADIDDRSLPAIKRAATRGTELTQRLLAFSRRQPLVPQAIDMRDMLGATVDLLRRTLGESVEISVSAPLDIWPALADPGQLDNAMLNLAINARDAMNGSGRLEIEALNRTIGPGETVDGADLQPGEYVAIRVSDSGAGMAPDVRERALEPFFTTKEEGSGSGLGLSMVYGFARQSGGTLTIDSVEGKGTAVEVLLPRASCGPAAGRVDGAASPRRGSGQTILLVEDNEDVREMVTMELRALGYRVLIAEDGLRGREIVESGAEFDLLLSDVMLPGGISGPDLAACAAASRPGTKILFISGYAGSERGQTPLPEGAELLPKPFQKKDLAERLYVLLNGDGARGRRRAGH